MTLSIPHQLHERVRGSNLAVFIKSGEGVPAEECILRAEREGLVIASNPRIDNALIESEEWKNIEEGLSGVGCYTGTAFAYVEPTRTLDESCEKSQVFGGYVMLYADPATDKRWIFPVPEEYLSKKDVVLAINHPNFRLEIDGNNRIFHPITSGEISLVERFPAQNGWCTEIDARYGIPIGAETGNPYRPSDTARFLLRYGFSRENDDISKLIESGWGRAIGLIGRTYGPRSRSIPFQVQLTRPSAHLGCIVEAP